MKFGFSANTFREYDAIEVIETIAGAGYPLGPALLNIA
jgi:hypothetical protein